MDNSTLRAHLISLFVLGTAIVLVFIAKKNFKDFFVANVPTTRIGNANYNYPMPPGGYPKGEPRRFEKQYFPAQTPYMAKPNTPCSVNPVTGKENCSYSAGYCKDGQCVEKPYNSTVFGQKF